MKNFRLWLVSNLPLSSMVSGVEPLTILHRPLPRPSGSYQWSNCSASLLLQAMYPEMVEVDDFSAEEGTATHWVGEQLLRAYKQQAIDPRFAIPQKSQFVTQKTPEGFLITEEMWDGAVMYVDYILSFMSKTITANNIHIEVKVALDNIYPGMSGTPDCWFYDSYNMILHIFDLKFGRKFVSEYENPQEMIYGSGIINTVPAFKMNEQLNVQLHIIQPRRYHEDGYCRAWTISAVDMRNHINRLSASAFKAMSDDITCNVGTHCHYCTARHVCNALHSTVQNCVDVETGYQPLILKGNALSSELTLLRHISDMVKFRLVALEEQAMYELSQGQLLPDWSIETKLGHTKWRDECNQQEILTLGEMMGVDLSVVKLDTPTQVKTKLKKMKIDPDIIDQYSIRPKTGIKLVPDDGIKAKRAFGK